MGKEISKVWHWYKSKTTFIYRVKTRNWSIQWRTPNVFAHKPCLYLFVYIVLKKRAFWTRLIQLYLLNNKRKPACNFSIFPILANKITHNFFKLLCVVVFSTSTHSGENVQDMHKIVTIQCLVNLTSGFVCIACFI